LDRPSRATIEIYNILGQKIKTLFDGFQTNEQSRIIWDATDNLGHSVPAGVYIYSLKADENRMSRKMLLIDSHMDHSRLTLLHKSGTSSLPQDVLYEHLSNRNYLRVTGNDIYKYEQDLVIAGDMAFDIMVSRTTITDVDGNIYRIVKIGHQWWMAENLRVIHYCNGDPNATGSNDDARYFNYDNDEYNVATYGRLYYFYAVYDERQIAPAGWRVPDDMDWMQLEMYLGMSQSEAFAERWRGTVEGGKLKEAGTLHWRNPNEGATNLSGFSALPAGYRYMAKN
jgi:uncharacterized protein (TIGR02145 family)